MEELLGPLEVRERRLDENEALDSVMEALRDADAARCALFRHASRDLGKSHVVLSVALTREIERLVELRERQEGRYRGVLTRRSLFSSSNRTEPIQQCRSRVRSYNCSARSCSTRSYSKRTRPESFSVRAKPSSAVA